MKRLILLIFSLPLLLPTICTAQFSKAKTINEYMSASSVLAFADDFDGDGIDDLFSLGVIDLEIEPVIRINWYKNSGDGAFEAPILIDQFSGDISNYFIKDLDQDGITDLILFLNKEDTSSIVWYHSNGQGLIEKKELLSFDDQFFDIGILDVNGDGHLDIIAEEDSFPRALSYYPNDGEENFGVGEQFKEVGSFVIGSIAVADLNSDGLEDIISYSMFDSPDVHFLVNLGQGAFGDPQEMNPELTSPISNFPLFEDMDGDQDLDMIYSTNGSFRDRESSIFFVENLGDLNFAAPKVLLQEERFFGEWLSIFDIDQDQDLDLFSGNKEEDNLIRWLENDGEGNFTRREIVLEDYVGFSAAGQIIAGQFNQDNKTDLAFALYDLIWLPNEGQQRFETYELIDAVSYLSPPSFIDYNDDGLLDMISHLAPFSGEGNIDLSLNIGSGQFNFEKNLAGTNGPLISFKTADLNQDGHPDMVGIESNSGQLVAYLSDPQGGSPAKIEFSLDFESESILFELIDIDSDEDFDIVYSTPTGAVEVFSNDGSGKFTKQVLRLSDVPASIFQLVVEDLNHDQLPDIALIYYDFNFNRTLNIFFQDEMNNFPSSTVTPLPAVEDINPYLLRTGDIDQDGNPDLLVSLAAGFGTGHSIYWYPNLNSEPLKLVDYTGSFEDFIAMDYNKDQKMDFFIVGNPDFAFSSEIGFFTGSSNSDYSFTALESESAYESNQLSLVDLDGDLDQDLVVTYNTLSFNTNNALVWYENLIDRPSIQGVVFLDENQNGEFDEEEKTLPALKTRLTPNGLSSFTDIDGQFQYYINPGSYQLTAELEDSCFILTTPDFYDLNIEQNQIYERNFGVSISSDYHHLSTDVKTAPTRCGFTVASWISIENDGCSIQDGQLKLVIDPAVSLFQSEPVANQQIGDTLIWNFPEMFPRAIQQIQLQLMMPGVEAIGDSIFITSIGVNQDGTTASTNYFKSEIRCAYDPNDKLVAPERGEGKNYTLFEEELGYTIRFQNTGNDTAFTVVIRDTLDVNLDLSSFRPLNASHPFSTLLNEETRAVSFTFDDILLPDSTTNEPLSHGYVSFAIAPNSGLAENTVIDNTAGIYFDFNPPIITNTVANTMVSTLPFSVNTNYQNGIKDLKVEAFPNPFLDELQFELESGKNRRIHLRILDVSGKQVFENDYSIASGASQIRIPQLKHLSSGSYYFQIKTEDGMLGGKLVKMRR